MSKPVIIIGAGGHGRVLAATLQQLKWPILGITDPGKTDMIGVFSGLDYLGDDDRIADYPTAEILLANGLGSVRNTDHRADLFTAFRSKGYRFARIIHPAATLLASAECAEGVQIMAGAVIGVETRLEENVLVNTGTIVEHGCRVGAHSHVASGAVICGDCALGSNVHVGAGATLIQGIEVGDGAIIAAGSVVTKSVPAGVLAAGVPAQIKRYSPHD